MANQPTQPSPQRSAPPPEKFHKALLTETNGINTVDGRNPAPAGMYEFPVNNGKDDQPQLVPAGFLNHQQWLGGGNSNISFIFHPKIGEDEPDLFWPIFFKGVAKKPPTR